MTTLKTVHKCRWKKWGIEFNNEEFEFLWGVYESIDKCMLCSKHLIGNDKCLDHNHETCEVRYILCRGCNSHHDRKYHSNNKLKEKHILEFCDKRYNIDYYVVKIEKNKKVTTKYFNKKKYTLEQVKEQRDILLSNINE